MTSGSDESDFSLSEGLMRSLVRQALTGQEAGPESPVPDWLGEDEFPYQIESFAGRGGSGFVWKALPQDSPEPVALKVIPFRGDPEFARERWLREARVAESIDHPNLMGIRDHGLAPDTSAGWLALEWIEGSTLREFVDQEGPLPWPKVREMIPQICSGLTALHDGGLVHRDVKPANLLWNDEEERLVIADFGVALPLSEERLTRSMEAVYSPGYNAPEQIKVDAEVDHRADQFSLAVTLWELLSGEVPVGAFGRLQSKAPRSLEKVLRKALSPDPKKRYPSIPDFEAELLGKGRWGSPVAILSIVILSVIGLAVAGVFQLAPADDSAPVAEIRTFQSGQLPIEDVKNGTMELDLSLASDGGLVSRITTKNNSPLTGFSAQCTIVFRDASGAPLHVTLTPDFGVNGRYIPGMSADRTDTIRAEIPPAILDRIASVDYHPHDASGEATSRWEVFVKDLERAVKRQGGKIEEAKTVRPVDILHDWKYEKLDALKESERK